jgi:hypothetical protein
MNSMNNKKDKQLDRTFYWSDLHENHLKRRIDRLMLDEGGREELVESLLREESPRSSIAIYENRRVVFDEDFIKYRILRLMSTLEWYEIRTILKSMVDEMKSSNSTQALVKRLMTPKELLVASNTNNSDNSDNSDSSTATTTTQTDIGSQVDDAIASPVIENDSQDKSKAKKEKEKNK